MREEDEKKIRKISGVNIDGKMLSKHSEWETKIVEREQGGRNSTTYWKSVCKTTSL